MKTKIYIMSLMLFAAGIHLSFGQDIHEPNDTYETATPVTCGQELTAYIQVEGDIDWYEIEMEESGVLEVAVTSVPDNIDINVEIHQLIDNVLTLIADDRDSYPDYGQNMFANAVMNAGTYLIVVYDKNNNNFNDSDPYQMALTCTPNALELNQIYEEAALISTDTCFEANIYGDNHTYTIPQDVDWFKVQVDKPGVLEVAITSVPDNIDIEVQIGQVIDNVLTLIADDRDSYPGYGENMFASAVINPGTYLIVVYDKNSNNVNEETYNICTSFTPNALELNQIYEEATSISLDTCFEANIYGDNHTYTIPQDVDWFKVQVDNPGVLEVAITSVPDNIDIEVEIGQIIDNVLTLIADDRDSYPGYGENMFANAVMNPGTYLIVVFDKNSNNMNEETYNICTSFTPNALELNQIYEEAAPISMDTCFEANIYGDNHTYTAPQDVDWFKLQVDEDNYNLEIAVTSVPDNIDIDLAVYQIIDNVLTLIADDGDSYPGYGENMFVSVVVDAGTYLIVVEDKNNNNFNEDTYNFCLSFMDIDEQSLSHQLGVFPNPNNGQFSVKLLTENSDLKILEVSVFDHIGRENTRLREDTFTSNEVSLNMQNSARGIYLIKIRTNQGVVTKKILVQ